MKNVELFCQLICLKRELGWERVTCKEGVVIVFKIVEHYLFSQSSCTVLCTDLYLGPWF